MTMKTLTDAQRSRQHHRHRTGRYDRHNPCELCGRSAGAHYYSDERVNDALDGLGLILDQGCGVFIAELSDERALEVLTYARGLTYAARAGYAKSIKSIKGGPR